MTEDDRHQQVMDEAWAWLKRVCDWFDRRAAGDERAAQLQRWNGRQRSSGGTRRMADIDQQGES